MPSRLATIPQRKNERSVSAAKKARNSKTLAVFLRHGNSGYARMLFEGSFLAQDDFAVAYQLVVQPQTVFICCRLAAWTRRTTEQAHAGRCLKNIRRERTTVHVELHPQIPRVGDPVHLVAFINHDDFRAKSNQYGPFTHFSSF